MDGTLLEVWMKSFGEIIVVFYELSYLEIKAVKTSTASGQVLQLSNKNWTG